MPPCKITEPVDDHFFLVKGALSLLCGKSYYSHIKLPYQPYNVLLKQKEHVSLHMNTEFRVYPDNLNSTARKGI